MVDGCAIRVGSSVFIKKNSIATYSLIFQYLHTMKGRKVVGYVRLQHINRYIDWVLPFPIKCHTESPPQPAPCETVDPPYPTILGCIKNVAKSSDWLSLITGSFNFPFGLFAPTPSSPTGRAHGWERRNRHVLCSAVTDVIVYLW